MISIPDGQAIVYHKPLAPADIPAVGTPDPECMCCWYVLHPDQPYPEDWSSTVCQAHADWYVSQLPASREQRRARRA